MRRPRPTRPMLPARLALALTVAALLGTACDLGRASDVLVLARRGDATSQAIARHYADLLGLPADRVLALTLTIPLGATTIDAETYRREIAEPIERRLVLSGDTGDVQRLVTTRGLPLLVEDCAPDPRDCQRASLDAALAQLGRTPDDRAFARVANPYFRDGRPFEDFVGDQPDAPLRFLVTRLTASHAREEPVARCPQRIVDALARPPRDETAQAPVWRVAAGATRETWSAATRLLLDPVADRLAAFDHIVCDACDAAPLAGLVIARDVAIESVDRLDAPGVVLSLIGSPATARAGRPSVFARSVDRWLARGATTISLHLADPTLAEVARPDAQLEAWARGLTAAEAHYQSLPQLGGSQVLVGDGLRVLAAAAPPAALEGDRDGDGIADARDNCPRDPNPTQRDTNGDGLGNLCDADVDDDGDVDTSNGRIYPLDARGDLEAVILTARNGPYDPDHDLDGDGRVDEGDLLRVQLALARPPGS